MWNLPITQKLLIKVKMSNNLTSSHRRFSLSRFFSQRLNRCATAFVSMLVASGLTFSTLAKEADFAKEIVIDAKKQSMDIKNHIIIFSGGVLVSQGTMNIKADTLRMYSKNKDTKGQEIIIATGTPAKYSQELDDGQVIHAQANEIRYDLGKKMLRLIGNSELNQNDSLVKGSEISYNLINQELVAEGDKETNDVVTTIFKPEKSDKK